MGRERGGLAGSVAANVEFDRCSLLEARPIVVGAAFLEPDGVLEQRRVRPPRARATNQRRDGEMVGVVIANPRPYHDRPPAVADRPFDRCHDRVGLADRKARNRSVGDSEEAWFRRDAEDGERVACFPFANLAQAIRRIRRRSRMRRAPVGHVQNSNIETDRRRRRQRPPTPKHVVIRMRRNDDQPIEGPQKILRVHNDTVILSLSRVILSLSKEDSRTAIAPGHSSP